MNSKFIIDRLSLSLELFLFMSVLNRKQSEILKFLNITLMPRIVKYRLQWQAKEQQKALQSEVSDREKFVAEVGETVTWLKEAQLQLEEPVMLGTEVEAVEQALENQQVGLFTSAHCLFGLSHTLR